MKFKKHPVTGEPLALKDVVKLHFAKGPEGGYMCPVLNKVITALPRSVLLTTPCGCSRGSVALWGRRTVSWPVWMRSVRSLMLLMMH